MTNQETINQSMEKPTIDQVLSWLTDNKQKTVSLVRWNLNKETASYLTSDGRLKMRSNATSTWLETPNACRTNNSYDNDPEVAALKAQIEAAKAAKAKVKEALAAKRQIDQKAKLEAYKAKLQKQLEALKA